jgi:hypothetical protein
MSDFDLFAGQTNPRNLIQQSLHRPKDLIGHWHAIGGLGRKAPIDKSNPSRDMNTRNHQ